jgi:hypothetical protein
VEFRNPGRSPDKTSKLWKGSGVDGKARISREEWKWIGSPLTLPSLQKILFHEIERIIRLSIRKGSQFGNYMCISHCEKGNNYHNINKNLVLCL